MKKALAVLLALTAAAAVSLTSSSSAGLNVASCGVERWTVKTLQDRPRLRSVETTTIAHLVSLPAPRPLPGTRLPVERSVFRVVAAVTLVRSEDDGDLHLVLEDAAGRTMIAESPTRSCTGTATTYRRNQMEAARSKVRVCERASVTGVAFFDFRHGQTGVAPNAIELHPVLGFRCST